MASYDRRTEILVVAMFAGFFLLVALGAATTAHALETPVLASIGIGGGVALLTFLAFLLLLALLRSLIKP